MLFFRGGSAPGIPETRMMSARILIKHRPRCRLPRRCRGRCRPCRRRRRHRRGRVVVVVAAVDRCGGRGRRDLRGRSDHAQCIVRAGDQVLSDVVRTMYYPRFIEELATLLGCARVAQPYPGSLGPPAFATESFGL
jgi:hypothetical protein